MKIAVLDFSCGELDIIDKVPQMESSDDIEEYLSERLNYNPDKIQWMDLSKGRVNFLTPDDYGAEQD